MNALTNCSEVFIESICCNLDIFLRWKYAVLQMLEMGLSNERLVSRSTPRFLTDDEDLTEQPSIVTQYSRLVSEEVFWPIIRISAFSELIRRKLVVILIFCISYAFS